MSFLQNYYPEIITYILLAASILSFWLVETKKFPLLLFSTSFLFALISNQINWLSLISIGLISAFLYLIYHKKPDFDRKYPKIYIFIRISAILLFVVLAILIFSHKIPGYNNWRIFDVKLSEYSDSFEFWLNFDKPIIGFMLLLFAYYPVKNNTNFLEIFSRDVFYFFIKAILTIILFGIAISYLTFDPKFPSFEFLLLWGFKMVFFTVIVEELFFRFFIQNHIITFFQKHKSGETIGWILSSILFGLFHIEAGIEFVFLATISGLFYGKIYLKTKRIESAMLLHFIINFIHLIFFAYPR